jgi:hypothetical protein
MNDPPRAYGLAGLDQRSRPVSSEHTPATFRTRNASYECPADLADLWRPYDVQGPVPTHQGTSGGPQPGVA